MLSDIEAGLVGAVIVKDMSRFGRNYLEVGLYTEIRFPELGVRFIAVNDGVDSDDQMGNDFTPFRNIINEWSVESLSVIVEASEAQAVNVRSFLKIVKKYTEPTSLTSQLLHEFVDKIVVHEADKSSGHRIQRIDVHYNFIGEVDFSPEFRR